ncbi:hypothetical protein [Shewanella aestuarii]|uniref:Uncharacterized protein n=1 Tax=Shewanella aestuarii TaxID=1028752 RepID=A0A6G9QPW3_9GAMM|nr:hypothetical protein [Shewanella aestuarii]QIR16512.1 hypothetical protein HBH39_18725 [Shewanella aestuarii]
MSKLRASEFMSEMRAHGLNDDIAISTIIDSEQEPWKRVELLAYMISQSTTDQEAQFYLNSCSNMISSLRDELVYSRQVRKSELPPRLDVWLMSSTLKLASTLDCLFDPDFIPDIKQNLVDSLYNPLAKRSEYIDQQLISFLLDNHVYRNNEDIHKAYIEFIAAITSEPELDTNIAILDKFILACPDVSSIEIFGKTSIDLFNKVGHERTASTLFSRMVDAATQTIAVDLEDCDIPEFAPTLNNSL